MSPPSRRAPRRQSFGRQVGHDEKGFSLIEVVLALVLLAGLLAATTTLVENAMAVSRTSRLRQLATDIATSMLDCAVGSINLPSSAFPTNCGEQEALLSAQGYSGLNGVDALSTVSRGGVTFTIEQQVSPGNGTCSQPSGGAPPELEVNDWVTWAGSPSTSSYWWQGGLQGNYVEASTLIAVPAAALNSSDGNILVQVTDDDAPTNGQSGVTVTLSPGGQTATTTSEGCVLFTNLTPQSYTITASKTGWIDSDNDLSGGSPSALTMSGTVTAGNTLTVPYTAPLYYAQAATVNATYAVAAPNTLPSNITSLPLSFYNTNLGSDPYVGPAPGSSGDEVFPFPGTSYSVVAGSCVVAGTSGNPGTPDTPDGSATAERERITVEVGGKRLEVVLPADLALAGPAGAQAASRPAAARGRTGSGGRGGRGGGGAGAAGGDALVSPMQGTIVKIVAEDGQEVSAGDTVVVLEAMKMEQPLTAHKDGTVADLAVQVGQTVSSGEIICQLRG